MKFFIGGEPFYSPKLLFSKKNFDLEKYINSRYDHKYKYYTGGGIYSLFQILRNIKFGKDDYCFLPSYTCPTVLKPIDLLGIKYKFFKINLKLEIDEHFLLNSIDKNCKSILFINYFGFPISDKEENFLLKLQSKGIVLIQDIVHSFFSDINLIGDFCFNSFRKFLPIDGSVILSKTPMKLNLKLKNNKYLFNKTLGQFARNIHFLKNLNLTSFFISRFEKAEKYYYNNYNYEMCGFSTRILERLDLIKLNKRREYFLKLLSEFYEYAIFKKLNENCIPLGFPILLNDRDRIRAKLAELNIYCPIHWKLTNNLPADNYQDSTWLSNNILTLPITETINQDHFLKYVELIKGVL